jgi:hypothetical protein
MNNICTSGGEKEIKESERDVGRREKKGLK